MKNTRIFRLAMLLSAVAAMSANSAGLTLLGDLGPLQSVAIGVIDVSGWACAQGSTIPVTVQIWAGSPSHGGVQLTSVKADQPSEPAVATACQTKGANYRFLAPLTPAQLATYGGRLLFGTINGTTAQLSNGSAVITIPTGASSVQNVKGIGGLNLLVDCAVNGALNCAGGNNPNPPYLKDPAQGHDTNSPPGYAYGASIIHDRSTGIYHAFFCSVGNLGWDSIRHATSPDGINWSVPVIVLSVTGAANTDLSACDPSVVRLSDGYYYMFYGSAYVSPKGNTLTDIQVARSSKICGPYAAYSQNGKWGATAEDPPAILIKPANDVPGYGAGQPTLVMSPTTGLLQMWYTDTSLSTGPNILMATSDSPTAWGTPGTATLSGGVPLGEQNVDVKFDPATGLYAMYSLDTLGDEEVIQIGTSADGVNWNAAVPLPGLPDNPFSYFGQNIGVSGDSEGHLIAEPLLVTYMAPYPAWLESAPGRDLTGAATQGLWDLYGSVATTSDYVRWPSTAAGSRESKECSPADL